MSCSVHAGLANAPRQAVSVDGAVIPHDAISREAQNHAAPTPLAAWTAAARALVVREVLLREAARLGIEAVPLGDGAGRFETAADASIRVLLDREIVTPEPDEEICRRYYEHNRARFRSPDIFEAAHILFAARRSDRQAFERARADAIALLEILTREPGRFAELARAHSACPSGSQGGNLGQITRGQTTPEFETALGGLEPGAISPAPVETRYGFHIIRLERRIAAADPPFDLMRERIAAYLAAGAYRIAAAQYVARLAARFSIEGVALPAPAGPWAA